MNRIIIEDIQRIIAEDLPWQTFKGKSVLITGANGMLPAYFVHTFMLLNQMFDCNIKVFALVRNREKSLAKFSDYAVSPLFKMLVQDVIEPIKVEEHIHFIIHGASQASPKYYGVDPIGTINANVLGTHQLLHLAHQNQSESFLFLSTGDVYGISENSHEIHEHDYCYVDILNVRSCYSESKRLAETMCIAWMHQKGIPVKISRICHSYGPGMLLDDGRVFADFVRDIVNNRNITLNSDGSAKRPFCYITDCIIAMMMILLKGETGQAYNIANLDGYLSVKELAELLVGLFPEKKLQIKMNNTVNPPGYLRSPLKEAHINVDRLKSLGWKPQIGVRDGFLRTVKSFEV